MNSKMELTRKGAKAIVERVTIKAINAAIADLGFEIVRGPGYFYFAPLPSSKGPRFSLHEAGVYVFHLSDLSVEKWRRELEDKIEEAR